MGKPPDYDVTKFRKCGKHGLQDINEFYAFKDKSRHGKEITVYRCKFCIRGRRTDAYRADPKANNEATNAWRRANPEQAKAIVTRCYEKNKDKYLPRAAERRLERRLLVLRHYAEGEPRCCLCSESHYEFLALDHIDGGGTKHHEELGDDYRGEKFYKWIIKQNFPSGYRVLCHNCNFKEHMRHNRESFELKIWEKTHKTRIIEGVERPVDIQKLAIQSIKNTKALKLVCLVHYSSTIPSCACCKNEDIEVLSIDHLKGGGKQHRKETGEGTNFYKSLKVNGFPQGYRVLCLNCNFSYGLYKHCPHQRVHNAS